MLYHTYCSCTVWHVIIKHIILKKKKRLASARQPLGQHLMWCELYMLSGFIVLPSNSAWYLNSQ